MPGNIELFSGSTAAEIGKAFGDYFYIWTQIGNQGHVPVQNIAHLTILYALASQMNEQARPPVLNSICELIRREAEQLR